MKGNFDSIINDTRPVIVDFHALWCGLYDYFTATKWMTEAFPR